MTKSDGTPDLDETTRCVACDNPNVADDFVQCDRCDNWWHYSCAGVSGSVAHRDWVCSRCLPVPAKSVVAQSTTSSCRARLQLELQRLAEEHELEKRRIALESEQKYLQKKYQLLESNIGEDGDNRSVASKKSRVSAQDRAKQTKDWIDRHSDVNESVHDDIEEDPSMTLQRRIRVIRIIHRSQSLPTHRSRINSRRSKIKRNRSCNRYRICKRN